MARSAEKAMTALARWRAAYVDKINEIKKRPHFAGDCEILKDAMYFRRQVVHEISRKIAQIQNPSLGEYKLRDLNDEINKLIREKDRWDVRIKELGGPDYREDGPKLLEKDGKEVPGNRGYRYFGAARDLPGVRELFEDQPQPIPRKTRGELMKSVDISYYGNCDEDDGVILPVETAYEEKLMAKKAQVWRRRHADEVAGRKAAYYKTPEQLAEEAEVDEDNPDDKDIYDTGDNPADTELLKLYATAERDSEAKRLLESEGTVHASLAMALSSTDVDAIEAERELTLDELLAKTGARPPGHLKRAFVAHASIPSQKEVEEALVEKRKRELLEQYMTPEFIESIQDTGKLLGVDKTKSDEVEVEAEEKEEEEEGENAATVTTTENEEHVVQDVCENVKLHVRIGLEHQRRQERQGDKQENRGTVLTNQVTHQSGGTTLPHSAIITSSVNAQLLLQLLVAKYALSGQHHLQNWQSRHQHFVHLQFLILELKF